ncbi:MAG: DUF2177 family protein [Candidatus Saccharibacteria bacterium]|jgi:uncharacterized membrane protein
MLQILTSYCIALATFVIVDLVWLNIAAKELYRRALQPLLAAQYNVAPAMLFYVTFIAVLIYFVIAPALKKDDLPTALIRAAVLGGICYATYNLTNFATLRDWPLSITIIDIIWGTVLTVTTTAITLIAMQSKWIKSHIGKA